MKNARSELNVQIKSNIKMLLDRNLLEDASAIAYEYLKASPNDGEIYEILSDISLAKELHEVAEMTLRNGLLVEEKNFSLNYKLATLLEEKDNIYLPLEFFKRSLNCTDDSAVRKEIQKRIDALRSCLSPQCDSDIPNIYTQVFQDEKTVHKKKLFRTLLTFSQQRKFKLVRDICNYCIQRVDSFIPQIYYYLGYAFNGLKKFEKAQQFHEISVYIKPSFRNIIEPHVIGGNDGYKESIVDCIGCGFDKWHIVNVTNQSAVETNKGLINPIRTWVQCGKCGLVYANPTPSGASLTRFYSLIAKEKLGGMYGNIKEREEFLFAMSHTRLDTIKKYADTRSLLDIGTGVGIFTRAALDKGWDAVGLELTPEDCDYAKKHYNIDLLERDFYTFTENEQFDVVTMFEVIEHMRHPQEDLIRIHDLVKDEGLFVLATPILDSDYARTEKELNVFWSVVSHLSYFTIPVLTDYLKKAGFKVLEIKGSMEEMGRMEFYCRKVS